MSHLLSRLCIVLAVILIIATGTASLSGVDGNTRTKRSTPTKPVIIGRPQSQTVHVNQSARFVCRVRSQIAFTITWFGNNSEMVNITGLVALINDTLILLRVQKNDQGTYKCDAMNEAGTSSSETTLTVLDPLIAPTITQMSSNLTALEGERVTFICKADGNPRPEIKWERVLENGAGTTLERPSPGSIRIPSVTTRDSGLYKCLAENMKGHEIRVLYLKVRGYPIFVESPPSNITVQENATVTLNCLVSGYPHPEVTWNIPNSGRRVVILSNNTLVISPVYFEDSGIYTCAANNSEGLRRAKSTFVRIHRRPKWICCPDKVNFVRNQTAIAGQSTNLDCSAAGYPQPMYEWIFNNTIIHRGAILTITEISTSNDGLYSCKVLNSLGSLAGKIFLSVLVAPEVIVKPKQIIVVPGQSVHFTCIVTGYPVPMINWYSPREKISENKTLVISNVTVNHHGEYRCEGENAAGTSLDKATLVVAIHPEFDERPPANISVTETTSVLVRCSATGPDTPQIIWYRLTSGGKVQINVSERISINPGRLGISYLHKNDTGIYLCEATNYAGVRNITFFINVQYRPYVVHSLKYPGIVVGREATLHCPIRANPAPTIQWTFPISFDGDDLFIPNVTTSHEGQYICAGVNDLGAIQAMLEVTVLTPARIVGLKKVDELNNWISLTCQTMGNPTVSVNWLNHSPLPLGSFTVDRGTLQIDKRYIDKMNFICNATNTYGWMSRYVRVPNAPQQLKARNITSSSVILSWMLNDTEIISGVIIERRALHDGSSWNTVISTAYTVVYIADSLQPFSSFLLRVKAINVLGASEPSTTLNITTLEGVPSKPTSLMVVSRELTSITVIWKPPEEPRGLLDNILYEVRCQEYDKSSSKFEIKTTNSTSAGLPFKITDLNSNTIYIIKVRAGRKDVLSGRTFSWSEFEISEIKTLQKAPTVAPKIVHIPSKSHARSIFVSWNRAEYVVDGYKLRYSEHEPNSNVTIVVIASWNMTEHVITGLRPSKYYQIQIRMFTSGGDGPWSLPVVVRTDQDEPISYTSSDDLPWKIALGVSLFVLVILIVILAYVYFLKKRKRNPASDMPVKKKSHKKDRYDFDNASHVSDESEGSVRGIYNVNMEDDIDLSMFAHSSHHTHRTPHSASALYVENPILPSHDVDSDDSYEAVRLSTFTARPSPLPTPGGTPDHIARRQAVLSHEPDRVGYPERLSEDSSGDGKVGPSVTDELKQLGDDILI